MAKIMSLRPVHDTAPSPCTMQGVCGPIGRGFVAREGGGMKLGCDARVSKHEQQTLPLQRDAMVTYAQQRGWTIVVMVEEVRSGARERLQRRELLRAAQRRTINAMMVWR